MMRARFTGWRRHAFLEARNICGLTLLLLSLALFAPVGNASGATLPQARAQLLAWHLRPAPLFPAALPAAFGGAIVTLDRFSGVDFDLQFAKGDCTGTTPTDLCLDVRRVSWGALDAILHDPATTSVQPMQVGSRSVYAVETGHSGAPSLLAWHEQGHTYMAIQRYVGLDEALGNLIPLVQSLRPIAALQAIDPCAAAWPAGRSVHRSKGRLVYDRQESLRMVCQGFGTDTGGLHIDWLTWGMKCTLVAATLGARYGDAPEFAADAACSATEITQHPSAVSVIGAACATASDLLGLSLNAPTIGTLAGLACAAAPAIGSAFGTKLESHHEFQVARDVIRHGRCLEFQQFLRISSWHAVACPKG
jgi:hypothetical protein